jgi:hypothetical protein
VVNIFYKEYEMKVSLKLLFTLIFLVSGYSLSAVADRSVSNAVYNVYTKLFGIRPVMCRTLSSFGCEDGMNAKTCFYDPGEFDGRCPIDCQYRSDGTALNERSNGGHTISVRYTVAGSRCNWIPR